MKEIPLLHRAPASGEQQATQGRSGRNKLQKCIFLGVCKSQNTDNVGKREWTDDRGETRRERESEERGARSGGRSRGEVV